MTIDNVIFGAVRHHLSGMVAVAGMIHSEMEGTGRPFDYAYENGLTVGDSIDSAQQAFLLHCKEMLKDPVPEQYAHKKDYHLSPADRCFLTGLYIKAVDSKWSIPENVERLRLDIDKYAPFGGFRSGI